MQEKVIINKLVSVIIPCYNGEKYLSETIESVFKQSYANFEIILINDGSTDQTEKIASLYIPDKRFSYINQANKGVSVSRNKGLDLAKGEYIIFLDADDLLEIDFIKKRVLFLQNNIYYQACGSSIEIINENGLLTGEHHIGVHDTVLDQVLFYKLNYSTCPSNYLFTRKSIIDNNIRFDDQLSSSADRLFLLQCNRLIHIGILFEDSHAKLLYRLHLDNMSKNISESLLRDNILFRKKVFILPSINNHYKRVFQFKVSYILSGGYYKLRKISKAIYFSLVAFFCSPLQFIKQICAA